jgi:phosphoserine phosphatase
MSRLHIFDMDGTLLHGTTASLELGRRMGCLDKVQEYERAAAHGEIDNRRFHELCQALWVNTTIADLCAAFEAAPWMLGLREVMEDITARGDFSAVISMSPSFWVERLLLWGVGSTYATEVFLGSPIVDHAKVLTHRSKLEIANRLRGLYSLGATECVAYGDSRSDYELFGELPFTVAVNGDSLIEKKARASYRGRDLRDAYTLGRSLLNGPPRG